MLLSKQLIVVLPDPIKGLDSRLRGNDKNKGAIENLS
jgi:hypothetical protein